MTAVRAPLRQLTARLERGRAGRATIRLRQRSAVSDAGFEAIDRDSDIGGVILAGALAYRLFVFALPLSFFLVSASGAVSRAVGAEPSAVPRTIGLAGVFTKQVASAGSSPASWWVALSSFAVLAYATRVLFRAVSIAHALAWQRSAAAVKVPSRNLGVFAAALIGQLALGAVVGAVHHRSASVGVVAVAAYALGAAALWLAVELRVPHGQAAWSELLPGSLLYGAGVTCVAVFNVLILGRLIESKAETYGALGTAATFLLAFFFIGRIIIASAVLNATLHERRIRGGA